MEGYYSVINIDRNTWCLIDKFKAHIFLLAGEKSALIIDTGNGFGDLLKEVRKITQKPLIIVNTHGHFDHIGSNYCFEEIHIHVEDMPVIKQHSNYEFRKVYLNKFAKVFETGIKEKEIEETLNKGTGCKYIPIQEGDIFELGGRQILVIEVPGHTQGSICLYDSNNKQLFSGDMVCDMGILLHMEYAASLSEFKNSLKRIKEMCPIDIKIYAGHHTMPIGIDFVEEYIECAEKIEKSELFGTVAQSDKGEIKIYTHERVYISLPI